MKTTGLIDSPSFAIHINLYGILLQQLIINGLPVALDLGYARAVKNIYICFRDSPASVQYLNTGYLLLMHF